MRKKMITRLAALGMMNLGAMASAQSAPPAIGPATARHAVAPDPCEARAKRAVDRRSRLHLKGARAGLSPGTAALVLANYAPFDGGGGRVAPTANAIRWA